MKKNLAIDIQGLTVHYGTAPVLWDIHLEIPPGHLVGIMGPNGAGKTTLIRAMLGFLHGTTGVVRVLNHRVPVVAKRLAYVPQQSVVDWDFPMTVRDLVTMGCYPRLGLWKRVGKEEKEQITDALAMFGLSSVADRQIGKISGGQKQRAFLARAIVQKAEVYFLDEPFEALDHVSEQIIVNVLQDMVNQGKTICVVHHDFASARKYFDWIVLLNTRLVAAGPIQETFTPLHLRRTYGKDLALVEEVLKISADAASGRTRYATS
jgi:manganese/zinc/iron transport system ATP- binding protein